MLIAITAAVSAAVLKAIGWALVAGAATAWSIEIAKRYDKWKANKPSEEVIPYSGPPLTPAQLYRKQTLTTQEIVPKYENVRPQNTRTVNTSGTTNVARVPVAKPVRRSSPSLSRSRPLLMSIPISTELIGKVSPVESNHDELVLEGRKLHQSTQPNLAKEIDLSTGVKPVSTDHLSIPPIDPKDDPKWKRWLKRRFTKHSRSQKTAEEFLRNSAEKMSRMNEPVWKHVARSSKPLYNIITGVSAAHQILHNTSPVIELLFGESLQEATDKHFRTPEDSTITVNYATPYGDEVFEGKYSVPDLRRILTNKEYKNMSESDKRELWANVAMYLHDKPEFNIIKGRKNAPYIGIDSIAFSPYLEKSWHENYIPTEVIDQSLDNMSNNLIQGIKSNNNKVGIFTVTPQDYDKIMRSDLPMWRKAVGAVDYGIGQFTKQWDENLSPWGIWNNVTNIFNRNDN